MKISDINILKEKYWYIFPITDYVNKYKETNEYKLKLDKLRKKEKKNKLKKTNSNDNLNKNKIVTKKSEDIIKKKEYDNDNEIFNLLDEIIKKNKKD